MGKHTPGPWHTGADGRIVYDANGWAISNAITFHHQRGGGQDRDNARLIAAAPEMVEVLRQWLAYDNSDDADFSSPGPMVAYAEAINATRALLSRIEGDA